MRTLILVLVAIGAAIVSYNLTVRPAQAFPGMMCFDSNGCSRCEVCVKAREFDPSGKCMKVAGCY